jgi:biopolymer transport protein ExbB/TolQ
MPTIKDAYIFDDLDNSIFKASRQVMKDFEDKYIKEAQEETGVKTIDDKIESNMKDFKSNMSQILNFLDEILSFSSIEKKGGSFRNNEYHGGSIFSERNYFNLFDKIQSLEGDRIFNSEDYYKYQPYHVLIGGAPPTTPDPLSSSMVSLLGNLPTVPTEAHSDEESEYEDDEDPTHQEVQIQPPNTTQPIEDSPHDDSELSKRKQYYKKVYSDINRDTLKKMLDLKTLTKIEYPSILKQLFKNLDDIQSLADLEDDAMTAKSNLKFVDEKYLKDLYRSEDKFKEIDSEPQKDEYSLVASKYNPLLQTVTKINNLIDKTNVQLKSMLKFSSHLDLEDTEDINSLMVYIHNRGEMIQNLINKNVFDPATNRILTIMIQKINSVLLISQKLTGFYNFDVEITLVKEKTPNKDLTPEETKQLMQTKKDLEMASKDKDIEIENEKENYEKKNKRVLQEIEFLLTKKIKNSVDNKDYEKTKKLFNSVLKLIEQKLKTDFKYTNKVDQEGNQYLKETEKLKEDTLKQIQEYNEAQVKPVVEVKPEAQADEIDLGPKGIIKFPPKGADLTEFNKASTNDQRKDALRVLDFKGSLSRLNEKELRQIVTAYTKTTGAGIIKRRRKKGAGFFEDFGRGFKNGFNGTADILTSVITANPQKAKEGMNQLTAGTMKKRGRKKGGFIPIDNLTPAQKQIITKYLL